MYIHICTHTYIDTYIYTNSCLCIYKYVHAFTCKITEQMPKKFLTVVAD